MSERRKIHLFPFSGQAGRPREGTIGDGMLVSFFWEVLNDCDLGALGRLLWDYGGGRFRIMVFAIWEIISSSRS